MTSLPEAQNTDALDAFLLSVREQTLLFCPNPGNAGDVFIACSTYQRLDRLECRFEVITPDCPLEITRGRIVLYGGGGDLVPIYETAGRFVSSHHSQADLLIVLPQTIRGNESLLSSLGNNVHVFCRELPSFEHVQRHAPGAHVELSEDMALGFDPRAAREQARRLFWPVFSSRALAWRNVKRVVRCIPAELGRLGGRKHLISLRTDMEKTAVHRPLNSIDIANVFNSRPLDPFTCLEATYRVMQFVDRFDKVTTDRLHVCIMAALLGKSVNFLPNSYGKNRAVYEHSIARRFPNVVWREYVP